MDKLTNLKIQKLLQEYSFLVSDDEYKTEVINTYKSDFLSMINDKHVKETNDDKIDEPTVKEVVEKEKVTAPENVIKKCKKLYRDIVKLTHPDKVNSEELVSLYMIAKEAYEEYNLFDLYLVGLKLNIKIELESDDIATLTELIEKKKAKLDTIEKSWLWMWVMSKTDEEKDNVVDTFIKNNKENL